MGRQMVKNGGNTFAFFTRNPRGGNAKAIDPADVAKFLELAREREIVVMRSEMRMFIACGLLYSRGLAGE